MLGDSKIDFEFVRTGLRFVGGFVRKVLGAAGGSKIDEATIPKNIQLRKALPD